MVVKVQSKNEDPCFKVQYDHASLPPVAVLGATAVGAKQPNTSS